MAVPVLSSVPDTILGEVPRPTLVTTDRRIAQALGLFRDARTFRVGQIASIVNLSESRFRHLFKQELGISPAHYLKIVRLGQARELLRSSS